MTRLVLLRHAATAWNAEGRIQGRADIPLSATGRAALAERQMPLPYANWLWYSSPLKRAAETAALLKLRALPEPLLIEMDWGGYEGRSLAELKAEYGDSFAINESRGLHFQPPNGEAPQAVQLRLLPWLKRIATVGEDAGAVTHKGVIRAIVAMAFDWPMIGKPPVKLDWSCLHEFRLNDAGLPEPVTMNIPLQ
jgi:broad specificity phosphatase PhoE